MLISNLKLLNTADSQLALGIGTETVAVDGNRWRKTIRHKEVQIDGSIGTI